MNILQILSAIYSKHIFGTADVLYEVFNSMKAYYYSIWFFSCLRHFSSDIFC